MSFCPVKPVSAKPGIIRVPADYPTITQAVNASNPGDTIIVSEGTYAEGEIWITKSNLTLIANGSVVVDGLKEARWVFYVIADNITIKGFTVKKSGSGWRYAGICLDHAQNCRIENNTATNNGWNGIFLFTSGNNTVVNNTASFNDGYGIDLDYSDGNTITNNTVIDNVCDGIHIGISDRNMLVGNAVIENHGTGIAVIDSDGNTLIRNVAINHTGGGVSLGGVGSNTLIGNNMTGNRYNLAVGGDLLGNEIDSTNFVDGKRVYYLKNQQNITVDPNTFPEVGYLAVINSTKVTVRNLTITNNWRGIFFAYVTNSTIENVNVTRNDVGICLLSSCRNTLKGNTATANSWLGFDLYSSRYNNLTENAAISNDVGIWVGGDHNFICNNIAMNGTTGIYVSFSDNNTIRGNTLAHNLGTLYTGGIVLHGSDNSSVYENTMANNDWGVFAVSATGSVIYHNNFISNVQEAFSAYSTSIWDNGYPSGGNYWSDYNDTDFHRGFYQNITGSDGIGDTPYMIGQEAQDNYPLMKPYGGPHDIGIVASVSEKTIIAEGYYTTATMNVTVINYGVQTETFNFTSQIGTTIQNQTLTLASRNSTTFTFTFNTTGLPKGIYTFSAYATPAPGETDISDNNYTTQIIITIPGDVDGDFDVDLYDAVKLLVRYGAKKGDPSYDANCDIDGDGDIDLYDAVILLMHYGQKDS